MSTISIAISGSISDISTANPARRWSDAFGSSAQELPDGRITFADGTDVGEINQIYVDDFSIASSATQQFDMVTGLTNVLGNAFSITLLKLVIVVLDTATTGDVWLGPQNLTNGCTAWFAVATANGKEQVKDKVLHSDTTGWTVDSTHKVLGINNGTLATITGTIILAGSG